jgi:hypothetical protein
VILRVWWTYGYYEQAPCDREILSGSKWSGMVTVGDLFDRVKKSLTSVEKVEGATGVCFELLEAALHPWDSGSERAYRHTSLMADLPSSEHEFARHMQRVCSM